MIYVEAPGVGCRWGGEMNVPIRESSIFFLCVYSTLMGSFYNSQWLPGTEAPSAFNLLKSPLCSFVPTSFY